jgi:hypothetical protein
MGKLSRNKGNSFERKIAKVVGKAYGRELRRVPLSGGIVLKCDIYDPTDDSFPLFIECKTGYGFTVSGMFRMHSPVFKFLNLTQKNAKESHMSKKYKTSPFPVVVFRGGDFIDDMVAFYSGSAARVNGPFMSVGAVIIMPLVFFLRNLIPDLQPIVKITHEVQDEDDGQE